MNSILKILTRIAWGIGIAYYSILSLQNYPRLGFTIAVVAVLSLLIPKVLSATIVIFSGIVFFSIWGSILFLFIKKYYLFSCALTLLFSLTYGSFLRVYQHNTRNTNNLTFSLLVKIWQEVFLLKSKPTSDISSLKKRTPNQNPNLAFFNEQKLQKMKNRYPGFFENQPNSKQKPNALCNSTNAQTQILPESKNIRKGKVQIFSKKQFDPKYKKTKTKRFIEEHQGFSIKRIVFRIIDYLVKRKEETVFITAFLLQFWFISYSLPYFETKTQNRKNQNTKTKQPPKIENFHYQRGLEYLSLIHI